MANDFLTFAGDPAANVMTQAQYVAAGFTARILGFATGTAISEQLNKVWRQSSIMTAMVGNFIGTQTGLNAVDDGTPSGMTALETAFTSAVRQVATTAVGTGYLPLTGGTLTGPLIVAAPTIAIAAPTAQYATLSMARNPGQGAQIVAYSAGSLRWDLLLATAEAETGGNNGSNFQLVRYNDSGVVLDAPLTVNRASGVVNFARAPTVAGGLMPYLPLTGGTVSGPLAIVGNGIAYLSFNANAMAFGWNGIVNAYVNGSYIGDLATTAYVGGVAGAYLPLAGGTITGALQVNSSLVVNGGSGFRSSVWFANMGDFVNFTDGRNRFRQWAGSWYDYWDGQTGNRTWWCATGQYMSLDGNANLYVSQTIRAGAGRIVSQGGEPSVCAYNTGGAAMGFWCDIGYMWFGNMDGSGNPSAGLMYLRNDGYLVVTSSSLSVAGQISAGANIVAGASLYAAGGSGTIVVSNGVMYPQWSGDSFAFQHPAAPGGGYLMYCMINGSFPQSLVTGGDNRVSWMLMAGAQLAWHDSDGSTWYAQANRSDPRFKRDIRDAAAFDSLGAIVATPIRAYRWNIEHDDREIPFGFVSTDLRETLPGTIESLRWKDDENADHLDPVALLAHIMRAIQQLNAKVEALHVRH